MSTYLTAISLLLGSMCLSGVVAAQPAAAGDEYERAVGDGLAAYQAGEYGRARELFERAHALQPNARTLRALGLTAIELKNYTHAQQELEASLADMRQPLTAAQRSEVGETLTWMRSALTRVQIVVEPKQAQVTIDGAPVAGLAVLEPGSHQLHIAADGYAPFDQAIDAVAGQERTLDVTLKRLDLQPQVVASAATPATRPVFVASDASKRDLGSTSIFQRWWFWTAVGVVVVAGGTTAIVALASKKDAPAEPPGITVQVLSRGP